MLRVEFDDLETAEYDIYFEATYNGVPFTGVAISEYKGIYSEWEYKDGFANGRWVSIYSNGTLQEEVILDMGKELSVKNWTEEGTLVYEHTAVPLIRREYFKNGGLKYEENEKGYTKYLRDGGILEKYIYEEKCKVIYLSNGDWVVKHKSEGMSYVVMDGKYLEFNDASLFNNWEEWIAANLCAERYVNHYQDIYPYFVQWIISLIHRKKEKEVEKIIIAMIENEEAAIKYDGITLAMLYHIKGATDFIKKERKNGTVPSGYGNKAYGCSIGEIAEKALLELGKEN